MLRARLRFVLILVVRRRGGGVLFGYRWGRGRSESERASRFVTAPGRLERQARGETDGARALVRPARRSATRCAVGAERAERRDRGKPLTALGGRAGAKASSRRITGSILTGHGVWMDVSPVFSRRFAV